ESWRCRAFFRDEGCDKEGYGFSCFTKCKMQFGFFASAHCNKDWDSVCECNFTCPVDEL
ncbi:hypothetical protein PIB30_069640, partial [Stylosanthes scabra]|nr:hypothetical protein [Stylosanthes scabra]